jgi:hypothetical protein
VVGAFTTDQSANAESRTLTVSPDGTLYITDALDNMVYVVSDSVIV